MRAGYNSAVSEAAGRSRAQDALGRIGGVRNVRAPRRRVAGNARPPRGEDQRHRDESRPGDRLRVKRGKLYPEQGQIGGHVPARRDDGALP